ncbi:hypothetical protein LINGRAHAP2_LOCUS681, partial [Linum grandiflorum]
EFSTIHSFIRRRNYFQQLRQEEDPEHQAGRRNMLSVPRRSQRGGDEDNYEVLLHPRLLEILESHHLYFLRGYSQILRMNICYIYLLI